MMLASAGAMMTANRTGVTSGTSSSLGVRTVSVSRRWYSAGTADSAMASSFSVCYSGLIRFPVSRR
jgi:hypothetical protein